MMCGYLRSQGHVVQRSRVRATLAAIDPPSTARRWSQTVARRVYNVPGPNSLWHMDGHMKLNRWGFNVHGCIDGYSRVITFLKCGLSNSAEDPLKLFAQATVKYGIPSRVRSDYGGENVQVALMMNLVRGLERSSHITGMSVHNQRIERLWKDVFKEVAGPFYTTFYSMEDEGNLQPDDIVHLWALQFVYLKVINERLSSFQNAWNSHRMRTEHNRTPEQIWLDGMLENRNGNRMEVTEVFDSSSSLGRMMNASLQRLRLPTTQNQEATELHADTPTTNLATLSEMQVEEISLHLGDIQGPKNKYLACVGKAKELLNSQSG